MMGEKGDKKRKFSCPICFSFYPSMCTVLPLLYVFFFAVKRRRSYYQAPSPSFCSFSSTSSPFLPTYFLSPFCFHTLFSDFFFSFLSPLPFLRGQLPEKRRREIREEGGESNKEKKRREREEKKKEEKKKKKKKG